MTPTYLASDKNLGTVSATLNGDSFSTGTAVSADGDYALVVTASDTAGNTSTKSVSFTIDATAPQISITGVSDGEITNRAVTPSFTATDPQLLR